MSLGWWLLFGGGDAGTFVASPPTPVLDEATAIAAGRVTATPRAVPEQAPRRRAADAPKAAKHGVVFVNFDGAELSSGWDDATQNVTQIGECAGSFAPYGDGAMRDAVLQAVRTDWNDFDILVTDTRPASGEYTMNMTGPSNPFGGGVLGIAPLDCDDSQTASNITYAFVSANDGLSAAEHATTIGQEVAHSFGLEHVDDTADIMNPYVAGGDPTFKDECLTIVQGGSCPDQHIAECGDAYAQNAYRELMTLFGPSSPDAQAPTVSITFPLDGQEFEAGTGFAVMVDVVDDQGIGGVTLYQDGAMVGEDASAPYSWQVNGLPSGVYEFYVRAVDLAGNEAMSDTVTIGIGTAPPNGGDDGPPGGGSDGGGTGVDTADDGSDGGGDGLDDGDGAATAGALPPGFGFDADEGACACRSTGSPSLAWAWVPLLVCRRRRRGSQRGEGGR
ncbi:MAG: hypothetical protein KBB21_07130 [Nannocystaceae bacterium]|nr:hypothetical protein [Nannocystaceae bacterium]